MTISIKFNCEKERVHIFPVLDFSWFTCGITVYSIKIGWLLWYIDLFWSNNKK